MSIGGCTTSKPKLSRSETLYEVLGVSETASSKEIKAAYRKKALKVHPDVNKEVDAQAQFTELKTAYETLIDPQQRASYDRSRNGWTGGFGNAADFGADWEAFRQYTRNAAQSAPTYTYEDLLRDLDREIESWQQERVKKKGRRAETVNDVLGDLADEFLDFLEMGIPESERQSMSGAAGTSSERQASSSSASARQSTEYDDLKRETVREAEAAARQAREAAGQAAQRAQAAAERARQEAQKASEIEDELAALKKKMGL